METELQRNQQWASDEERVRDFQRKIYLKAKQEKEFRFYVLYDKVRLTYFLQEAYRRCKANSGSAGIDGMRFEDIEREGFDGLRREIQKELKERTYKPLPVLRVYIPKGNGEKRALGIPTIKDRVVQMACKLVIEPIFEADFEDNSYGFRPKKSAQDAIKAVKTALKEEKTEVFDADIRSYFDTIPHHELLMLIAKRISDRNIIHLIKMWLKAPVKDGTKYTGGKKNRVGTPQGGVISPLLANIYLNLIDKAIKRVKGVFNRHAITLVRYADDFVLMGKTIPTQAIEYLKTLLKRMKLEINEDKSRKLNAREESFDFLGFSISCHRDVLGRNKRYWNIRPSRKSQKKVRGNIREYLAVNGHKNPAAIAAELNSILRGWIEYFSISGVSYPAIAKRKLRYYLLDKLRRFYGRKSQRKCKLYRKGALEVLIQKYGLINLMQYTSRRTANA